MPNTKEHTLYDCIHIKLQNKQNMLCRHAHRSSKTIKKKTMIIMGVRILVTFNVKGVMTEGKVHLITGSMFQKGKLRYRE